MEKKEQLVYRIGDLVDFTAPAVFESAKLDYDGPGIITGVKLLPEINNVPATYSYIVRWNDGRITTEWFGYIKRLNK